MARTIVIITVITKVVMTMVCHDGNDESDDLHVHDEDHKDDDENCPGVIGDGEWVAIRRGITIDSGSAAFVMPESWLPGI